MKKINCFIFSLVLLMVMMVLGSCSFVSKQTNATTEHTHDYANIYSKDSNNHWNECSCGEKTSGSNHTFGEWIIITEATEVSVGSKKQVCSVCNYENIVETPKLSHEHNYSNEYSNDEISHWNECSCGDKISVSNHTYDEWIIITQATEVSVGSKKQMCSICNYENIVEIPKLSHEHDYNNEYSKDGISHWNECSCGEKTSVSNHTYGEWIIITEATEVSVGSKKQICSLCNYENIVEIPQLEHVHNYTSEVISPKCEEDGYTKHTCGCGYEYNDTIVSAFGHTEVIDEAVEPKCSATGLTEGSHCSVCEKTLIEQELIEKTPHIEKVLGGKDATCENDGITSGKQCMVCDEVYEKQTIIPALGHKLDDGTSVSPTEITNGYTRYKCLNDCDYYEDRDILDMLLKFEINETNDSYKVVDASNTAVVINIPKTYNELPVTLIAYGAFNGCSSLTNITIPNSVAYIESGAFYNCTSLTSVTFEEGSLVTSIEKNTFNMCIKLTNIEIPSSVTIIGESSFQYCNQLTDIIIPSEVTSIEKNAFAYCNQLSSLKFQKGSKLITIGTNSFYNCMRLTNVEIPSSVIDIDNYSFAKCTSLTKVEIEETSKLEKIGKNAFEYCSKLSNIEIPNSIIDIGTSAFNYCTSLKYTQYNNAYYLGNATNQYLVLVDIIDTEIDSFVIEESTKVIYCNALSEYGSLTSIIIPNNVTSIGETAFARCSNLTSIILPNSLKNIGKSAFSQCYILKDIYYKGTIEDWCNITFDESSNPMEYAENFYIQTENGSVDYNGNLYTLLTELEIPNSVVSIKPYSFSGFSISSLVIPTSVTSIGEFAFRDCIYLNDFEIPNSVTSIGESAFSMCQISNIYYNGNIEDWCNIQFEDLYSNPMSLQDQYFVNEPVNDFYVANENGIVEFKGNSYTLLTELEIPNSVVSIKPYSFSGFSISSLVIPTSVTSIGEFAFRDCIYLNDFEIPNSVTSIGQAAFYRCKSLANVVIPNSISLLDGYVFYECDSLINLIISSSVTYVEQYAFLDCKELENVYYKGTLEEWCKITFHKYSNPMEYAEYFYMQSEGGNVIFNEDKYVLVTEITIPDSITIIGAYQFHGFDNITSVIIPNSVTGIGTNAFRGCLDLNYVSIANTVKPIGSSVFADCSNLTNVIIPNSVTEIGAYAFDNSGLEKIYYIGIKSEWNKIRINSSNDSLSSATRYYYSETQPTEEGNYWHYDIDGVTPIVW